MNEADIISRLTIVKMEMSVCRKGSTSVRIDLQNRLLSWRESNRWNRNFTRSINVKERDSVREGLRDSNVLNWDVHYGVASDSGRSSQYEVAWQLSLYIDDIEPDFVFVGQDEYPNEFNQWIEVISSVCRQTFQVLD